MLARIITITLCAVLWSEVSHADAAIAPAPVAATTTATATATAPIPPLEKEAPPPDYNLVILQGLNKVTGHVSKLQGPIGTVMNFGTLEIIARRCWKAPPEDRPENAALLEIREVKAEEGPKLLFLGWMFSSTPGLSAMENPVYDISVISCEYVADPEKNEVATATKTATSTSTKSASTKKKHSN